MGEPGRSYQPKTDPGPVPPELVARDGENTNPTRSWSIAPGSLRREIAAAYARIAELESQVADERWQTGQVFKTEQRLRKRIAELEEMNRLWERDYNDACAERDHWRDGWRMATENLDWARAERDRLREALERIVALESVVHNVADGLPSIVFRDSEMCAIARQALSGGDE